MYLFYLFVLVVLKDKTMGSSLIFFHKSDQVELLFLIIFLGNTILFIVKGREVDSSKEGTTFKQGNLCFLEYLGNIILSDKVKG